MFYCSHIPAAPLRAYIDRFWLAVDPPAHPRVRILPTGAFELVINLRDDEIRMYDAAQPERCLQYSGMVASGAYGSFFAVDPLARATILGVHFRPGGAAPFLGVPASQLADVHVDLGAIWGRRAAELHERLHAAATPEKRFSILEEALLARLRRAPERRDEVAIALDAFDRTDGGVRVRDVARQVGLSQRRFIQVFSDEVGLTPKLYSRVRRFQWAREFVRKTITPDWAEVAVACGYFDQSHLIRDFAQFAGVSPAAYLNQGKHLPYHLPEAG